MNSIMMEGWNRVVGERQGYIGLAIKDETVIDVTNNRTVNRMTTHWEGSAEEKMRFLEGKPLIISIFGDLHPPIKVEVGE